MIGRVSDIEVAGGIECQSGGTIQKRRSGSRPVAVETRRIGGVHHGADISVGVHFADLVFGGDEYVARAIRGHGSGRVDTGRYCGPAVAGRNRGARTRYG